MHNPVLPINGANRLNRRDVKLIKLILVEVVVFTLCTFAQPFVNIYTAISNSLISDKSAERRQIESFTNFITLSVLTYLNYNTTFYTHVFTSTTYRMEAKQLLIRLMENFGKVLLPHANLVRTGTQIPGSQQPQIVPAIQ